MALRDLKKERLWRRMVQGQARSGLSVRAWCLEHHLHEAGFYAWRKELARRDAERGAPAFVPVRVTEDEPAGAHGEIEIVLVSGRRVRVSGPVDRRTLSDVLAVLEGAGC
jgi:hypothetical protein